MSGRVEAGRRSTLRWAPVRPGGLIIAHNMSTRQADPCYVEFITTNPDLETAFLYMDSSGVGVTLKKR